MHYEDVRTIHLDQYRKARESRRPFLPLRQQYGLSRRHRRDACRVHARIIDVLSRKRTTWTRGDARERERLCREVAAEVRYGFGIIGAFLLQILIGFLVKIIINWLYDELTQQNYRLFETPRDMQTRLDTWAQQAKHAPVD